jgi:cholesterol transport system auxiliary component
MSYPSFAQNSRLGAAIVLMSLLGGCGALKTTTSPPPAFYSLDTTRSETTAATVESRRWRDGADFSRAPTLIVNPPHAASGFDSQRIIYVREIHQLEYFAHSEWVDTPARMIVPLIVAAVENSRAFRAVVTTPCAAAGDLRLDTEIIRLQQEFGSQPSHVRFTLRAYLVDNTTRQVLAQREFDASVTAAGDDPRSGVEAANRAVREVLARLAGFCSESAGRWRPAAAADPTGIADSPSGR